VYKYLSQQQKQSIAASHQGEWKPDIVVGTSIGAVNGAAIVQGITADELETFWLSLRENDIQGLPPGMGRVARWVANTLLRKSIGTSLKRVPENRAFSPSVSESWPPLPILPHGISRRLIGRWNNLLDTRPLYDTLVNRLGLKEEIISASPTALLISATNVQTGEGVIFSNRPIYDEDSNLQRKNVKTPIDVQRIVASCSIPLVYPWTTDRDGEIYWDGAVVANTPLGPSFDICVARKVPIEVNMEAVIVMMTPWWESDQDAPHMGRLPQNFLEAITWTLDWALLASFRAELRLLRTFNRLTELAQKAGEPQQYRKVDPIIVAPQEFLPVERIIDYDEPASRKLIDMGYKAAEKAFRGQFGSGEN
jgi:NTE family protein